MGMAVQHFVKAMAAYLDEVGVAKIFKDEDSRDASGRDADGKHDA
jgi:hypothetical protein